MMPQEKWNDEYLDLMRLEGDETADSVISRIIKFGRQEDANDLFINLATNVSFPNESFNQLPARIRDFVEEFFNTTSSLPPWADHHKLRIASDVFSRLGPEINLILFCKSLPMCYTCRKGAKVLYGTGRLLVHDGSMQSFTRRLMETAQFVVNVMEPGGFEEQGDAIVSIQKVRLIHAAIRAYTLAAPWDIDELGVPVNQEDLAITHLSFTIMILDALEQLGAELTEEEKEAYYHLWKVVGHLLGIESRLVTDNETAARRLMNRILDRQAGPSAEGTELTRACMDFLEHLLKKRRYKDIPSQLTRFFIGKKYSSILKVPTPNTVGGFIAVHTFRLVTTFLSAFRKKYQVIAYVSGIVKRRLIEMLIVQFNEGKQVQFRIPESLKHKWQ